MKRILINATQTEELRVAIVDVTTQSLLDLLVERQSYITKTGNIYEGTITAIEPSLDACFVNFGSERHGFLPFKEIAPQYYTDISKSTRPVIKDALKIGQKIMIQVEKEERGNKGAALTTYISLAGSYLVLMPNNPRAGGISRRVEGDDRDELREILANLPIPEEMGLIVRTAGVGKAITELQWDLSTLLKQWEAIQKASISRSPPFLIHQESDIVIRAVRDYLREDVTEILVDDVKVFERIKEHLEQIRPDFVQCVKLYTSTIPLFNRYQIEHQIESAHEREVRLPSGGSIVIGHTEALVAIDVNSGQATKGKDIEQTAFEINKEAARIIACQLRLRDIGGLVVIDFIDMPSMRHRREVEGELRSALKLDKARTQVGTISPRFGLLEMSRQRLRHSLGEATRTLCSRCDGWGSIRSVESLSLSILRMIEEDAIRPGTAQIQVQLPVDLATFIINEKREHITGIEKSQNIQILIIPNTALEAPHYRIRRLTEVEAIGSGSKGPSYRLAEIEEPDTIYKKGAQFKTAEEQPAVKNLFTETTSASQAKKPVPGLLKRLIGSLLGASTEEAAGSAPKKETKGAAVVASATRPTNPSDRHQRNQERGHQRGHNRHASPQTRRSPRHANAGERKISPLLPTATPTTSTSTTTAPPAPRNQAPNGRSRRGPRINSAQGPQRQANNSPPIIQPVKIEPLSPPNYPQPALSDTDLETYYQESSAFANKKPIKVPEVTNKIDDPGHKPTPQAAVVSVSSEDQKTTLHTGSQRKTASTDSEQHHLSTKVEASTITPTTSVSLPALHSEPLAAKPEPKPSQPAIIKNAQEDKFWTPHKIASAPAVAAKPNTTSASQASSPVSVQHQVVTPTVVLSPSPAIAEKKESLESHKVDSSTQDSIEEKQKN